MAKKKVLVDTVFLNKLSQNGKEIKVFKHLMDELDYQLLLHPYIAYNELDMYPYVSQLVTEGYIGIVGYDEFLPDEEDKEYYESLFIEIHDEIREHLEASGGKKQLAKLVIPSRHTVFTYRKAGMSLGDVHMILLAFFSQIPVILTEDSDIDLLKGITKRKMASATYELTIIDAVDVLKMIAEKEDNTFSKKDLVEILKRIGEREHQSEIKQAWNRVHGE